MLRVADDSGHPLAAAFTRFIGETAFPCVGAKAAVNRGGMRFVVARDFRSAWDDLRILPTLMDLAKDYRATPGLFRAQIETVQSDAQRRRHSRGYSKIAKAIVAQNPAAADRATHRHFSGTLETIDALPAQAFGMSESV